MSNYRQVSEALDRGVEPEMICQTCPWDRLCINPPTMTRSEVRAKMPPEDGPTLDNKAFTKTLIELMVFAGKDTQAEVCPVLAVRLRTSDGKGIADTIRTLMVAPAPAAR